VSAGRSNPTNRHRTRPTRDHVRGSRMRIPDNNNNNGGTHVAERVAGSPLAHSLARIDVYDLFADFTFHVTTPVELALTSFGDLSLVRVITSPAAHQLAAFRALGESVAAAPLRARRSRLLVREAVIRRLIQIYHVLLRRLVVLPVDPD